MSANIAIIYSGELREIAQAFGDAAARLSAQVRLLRVSGDQSGQSAQSADADPQAELRDLEWADGIAFGTPIDAGLPAPALVRFIEHTEPLWSSGRLHEKAVTVFTDEPEHFAPDSVLHPIYDALYHWGAVIVGPRAFELELDAQPDRSGVERLSLLSGPRLKTAQYRAVRLARLAGVLADDRARLARLQM